MKGIAKAVTTSLSNVFIEENRVALVLKLTFFALVVFFFLGNIPQIYKTLAGDGGDFAVFLHASRAFYEGQSPYSTPHHGLYYIYPLFFVTLLKPIAEMSATKAHFLWFFLEVCALQYSIIVVGRNVRALLGITSIERWTISIVVLAAFFATAQWEIMCGQVNLVVLALLVASCDLFIKSKEHQSLDSRKIFTKGAFSAILMAVAISLKVMPLVVLPLYLAFSVKDFFEEQWNYWATISATVVFCCVVLPMALVGESVGWMYVDYFQRFFLQRVAESDVSQTTFAFTPAVSIAKLCGMNAPNFPLKAIVALFLVSVPVLLLKYNKYILSFSLLCLLMPLLSSTAQQHYLLYCIPVAYCSFALVASSSHILWIRITNSVLVLSALAAVFLGEKIQILPIPMLGMMALYIFIAWNERNITKQLFSFTLFSRNT